MNIGAKGRPKVSITKEQLTTFQKADFTVKKMADHFQCSTKTVNRRLIEQGLNTGRYGNIGDDALDGKVSEIKTCFPNAGVQVRTYKKFKASVTISAVFAL